MAKKEQYWVITSRIKINEIEQSFVYGDEFPKLEDNRRTERLLDAGMLSTTRPTDIPEPPILEINHFEPSQAYVELPKDSSNKKKNEENK